MSKCSYLDCHVLYLLIKLSLQYWSLGAKKTLYYLKSRHLCGKLIIKFGLYMDSKVFLTRVESKEESRALPRFLTL